MPAEEGRIEVLEPFEAADAPPSPEQDELRIELQQLSRRVALAPESWTPKDAARMIELFDERAPRWVERLSDPYLLPLKDALARGGIDKGGICLEIGTGTGLQTATLASRFDQIVALDISFEMLSRASREGRSLAQMDAALLGIATASVDAIVLVNVPVFITEYLRVLRDDGAIVLASTRGPLTPIYLAPEDLLASAKRHGNGVFCATYARAGEGEWTVLRRERPVPGAR
jgi:SAM-dependent methyltransferase